MGRDAERRIEDFFGGNLGVTHFTLSTADTITMLAGQRLVQVQIDTDSTDIVTTLGIGTATHGIMKRVTMPAAGTREVTFVGHAIETGGTLYFTRPEGDSHTIFLTLLYR